MKSRQWSNFLKRLYLNLLPSALLFILVVLLIYTWITVLFIFIVLYLCFSSVSACLMQRLSFLFSEIKTYWTIVGLFSLFMSCWMSKKRVWQIFQLMHTFSQNTTPGRVYYACQQFVLCAGHRWHAVGWCARNRLSERERGDSRGWEHTRQVCTAYVVTWRL